MAGQTFVGLFTGIPWNTYGTPKLITLTGYNKEGQPIAKATREIVGPTALNIKLSVAAPANNPIYSVSLNVAEEIGGAFEYIDD